MTENEAKQILKAHNEWRRGGEGEMQDPKILGLAIDKAVESLDLPSVIDCANLTVEDSTHGEFEITVCGRCSCGPITDDVKYCPKCGVKIGKRCR